MIPRYPDNTRKSHSRLTRPNFADLPGQANNFYIYPAIGLAVYATNPKRVTDEMFIEAAKATADEVTDQDRGQGLLFPVQSNILEAEFRTALRIATVIFDRNLARVDRPKDIESWLRATLYKPEYAAYSQYH